MEHYYERIWGIENEYDTGRIAYIYEFIKKLGIQEFSLVDVACGNGLIADGLAYLFPKSKTEQFDIFYYPEWNHLRVKPQCIDLEEFIKQGRSYDVVLFLNSYRNYDGKQREKFNEWVTTHAKYFICSGGNFGNSEIIGKDVKGHNIEVYKFG